MKFCEICAGIVTPNAICRGIDWPTASCTFAADVRPLVPAAPVLLVATEEMATKAWPLHTFPVSGLEVRQEV